ncbi:MAG: response regulator [Desulfomonile tiedjei]|nr:response regulator [Desulfomonile tiedjei]
MEDWKVLLVDDEQEFVSTLAERLALRGVKADVAYEGEQALERIVKDPPKVVVLDLMMPGMSGLAVLEAIRSDHPQIEVILLTGMGGTKEGIEGMRRGAFDYLTKPVDIDTLMRKIGEAMKKSHGKAD